MRKTFITTSLIAAVVAMPAVADPTAQELLDQKTVTSKYYVDTTKQDIIPTDKVLLLEADGKAILEDIYVPALVLTNSAGTALNGDTVGVVDHGTVSNMPNPNLFQYTAATYDNFVPTVRTVATGLSDIWTSLNNTLFWSSTQTNAVNAYSVLFGNGTNQWSGSGNEYITGVSLAQGLALKQNIIAAGTSGNVVTYTGTAGQVASTAVSSAATYNGTTLTNGGDIANIAAVETAVGTKQDKMTCAGYVPGHENDLDYCWLYGDVQVATCKAYGESATSASQCCSGYLQSGTNLCGCDDDSDCPSGKYNNCNKDHYC